VATAVALVCLPASARAQRGFMTGNELQSLCNTNDAWGMVACTAYVMAIFEVMYSNPIYGWRACFPSGVIAGQMTDVVKRFLARHPEQRHNTAGSLVAQALAEAFPCNT
jgi:hypothetical protein